MGCRQTLGMARGWAETGLVIAAEWLTSAAAWSQSGWLLLAV